MAEKQNFKKSVAAALEIPDEVALGSARITITGSATLSAENHRGIVEYLPGKIVFKTAEGQAEVLGERLTLTSLAADSLSVSGLIMSVSLAREEHTHGGR